MLLTPLIHRWNITSDDDEMSLPALIECLVFVIHAVGPRILPCAPQIYKRCVSWNVLKSTTGLVVSLCRFGEGGSGREERAKEKEGESGCVWRPIR